MIEFGPQIALAYIPVADGIIPTLKHIQKRFVFSGPFISVGLSYNVEHSKMTSNNLCKLYILPVRKELYQNILGQFFITQDSLIFLTF